ncbi:AlpA family transcriptional regulator [Paraburkholderia sp. CNPSo 3076]|uniref:helix-turn-helix transcriptional regulator n=1 Tax=Paraburkholderia sp. CNPSo 3076 TaxID=2940936 RepID=UPI0022506A19|nr:AlpA family transcriptional regulator [Paraburkholderia sp. CNPSo 3076]MCX5542590.1 AlpA family transcriptional regulator [Paraburkholderia sp. CNPSo 3076]
MSTVIQILRLPEVCARCALRRSTIYKKVAAGEFPTPIKLGTKASGWLESEVEDWLAEQIRRSRGAK